ncbi:MAG TPA: iron-containing redox enzyme family protein [Acidimicrobiales bacterium]|nr:iron-containing redox enzyme family protein [Acidimicrobiales bacterium]
MPTQELHEAVQSALAGRRLLDHPYYQAWQDGALTEADIARYAGQYRHFEQALPDVLAATAGQIDDPATRRLVEANLADETSAPAHLDLFDRFAAALGATRPEPAGPGAAALVDTYRQAVASGPEAALAVIAAYEVQAADIAATKGAALRRHLSAGPDATQFWDVHAGIEAAHARWTVEALDALAAAPGPVRSWARASADAWWAFLDEQLETLAPA